MAYELVGGKERFEALVAAAAADGVTMGRLVQIVAARQRSLQLQQTAVVGSSYSNKKGVRGSPCTYSDALLRGGGLGPFFGPFAVLGVA